MKERNDNIRGDDAAASSAKVTSEISEDPFRRLEKERVDYMTSSVAFRAALDIHPESFLELGPLQLLTRTKFKRHQSCRSSCTLHSQPDLHLPFKFHAAS